MRITVIAAALVLALAACTTREWMPDDIRSDATLNELGAAGYQRVCSAFDDYVHSEYYSNRLVQAVCLAHGITSTDDAEACGDTAQACLQTMPAPAEQLLDTILEQANCSTIGIDPVGCAATVAQLKACLDALEAEVDNVGFTLTCAAAGEPLDAAWWRVPLPAACQTIRELCPAG